MDLATLKDTIQTIFPEPSQDWKEAVPAQFNTVLAFEKASLTAFSNPLNPFKGAYFFPHQCKSLADCYHDTSKKDLLVAQVCVIFKLPLEYGHFDIPLA